MLLATLPTLAVWKSHCIGRIAFDDIVTRSAASSSQHFTFSFISKYKQRAAQRTVSMLKLLDRSAAVGLRASKQASGRVLTLNEFWWCVPFLPNCPCVKMHVLSERGNTMLQKNKPLLTSFNYGCRESADDSIIHSSIQPGVQAAALSCCCSARPAATLAAKLNWPFPLSPLCFAWKPLKSQEWAFFLILSDALTEHPVLFWSFFFFSPQWLRPLHGQRSEFFCRPSNCVSLLPLHSDLPQSTSWFFRLVI